ncbi:MAG: MOSC domain-containing protein [Dehalococcoidia bacterium]|nr:MOSC domain-containing protein [Dehalococcoidia bacterium]
MPQVVALNRYPVKGFTPEACDALTILADGRIAGDRVLAFRMATDVPGDGWAPKPNFLVLMNTPGLALLKLRYDQAGRRLAITHNSAAFAEGGLDPQGRTQLVAAVTKYAVALKESPLVGHPERLPLRLLGDGETPQFHDDPTGRITLHGRGSLASLGTAIGDETLNEHRFRTNISVEGLAPWEELGWSGRRVRIGGVLFSVARPLIRCLATQANPLSGERDLPVLATLTESFSQERPTFGVALALDGSGGVIHVGDEVTVSER